MTEASGSGPKVAPSTVSCCAATSTATAAASRTSPSGIATGAPGVSASPGQSPAQDTTRARLAGDKAGGERRAVVVGDQPRRPLPVGRIGLHLRLGAVVAMLLPSHDKGLFQP